MPSHLCASLALTLALTLVANCARDDGEPSETDEEAPATAPVDEGDGADDDGEALLAAELEAYEDAKPVFEEHCAICHQPGQPQQRPETLHHFSMDGYPFGGHHAHEMGEVIRTALGADGSEATMPDDDPDALSEDELELVVAWSEAFDRAHAAGVGHHAELAEDGHDHDHDHDHDHES